MAGRPKSQGRRWPRISTFVAASVWALPAAAAEPARLVISGAANAVLPSVGLELSYGVSDHLAVALQGTTLLAHNDVSTRMRGYVGAGRRGLYFGVSAHLVHSPLILSFPAYVGAAEVGYEWLTSGQWRVALEAGGGLLWAEEAEGGRDGWMPWPVINLRIGR